jgi:hypothetical protein
VRRRAYAPQNLAIHRGEREIVARN